MTNPVTFTATPTTGGIPLTVTFTDTTEGAVWWLWYFGDGTTSQDQNPVHTYQFSGTYEVRLKIYTDIDGPYISDPVTITAGTGPTPPSPPDVTFTATPLAGSTPLTVTFTDTTQPVANNIDYDTFDGTGTLATHVSNNGVIYTDVYEGSDPGVAQCIVSGGQVVLDPTISADVIAKVNVYVPTTFNMDWYVASYDGRSSTSAFGIYVLDNDWDWNGLYITTRYNSGQWYGVFGVYYPDGYWEANNVPTGVTDPGPIKFTANIIDGSRFIFYANDVQIADSGVLNNVPRLNLMVLDFNNRNNYQFPGWPTIPVYLREFVAYSGSPATPTARLWTFGDGTTGTGETTTHTYTTSGEYQATLTDTIGGINYTSNPQTIVAGEVVSIAPVLNNNQYFDQQGNFLAGGKVYTYTANAATTKLATYAGQDGTVVNPNPIILNEQGQISENVWLKSGGNYNVIVTKPDNETVLEAVNGVSTQKLIAGDHVFVSTVDNITTVSAEVPDPTLGHGTTFLFALTNDSEFAFHNVPFKDWNATTLSTDSAPDVVWDNGLLFNTKGSYTVQVTTTITPTTTWPLKSTSFGVILQDPITDNPVQRSVHTRYMNEGNGVISELQTTSFYDEFTVSVDANTGLDLYVVAHSVPFSEYAADVSVSVNVTKFANTRYIENNPVPPDPIPTIWLYDKFNGPAGEIDVYNALGNIYTHTADTGQTYGKGYYNPSIMLNGLGSSTVGYPWNSPNSDAWVIQQTPASNYWIELDVYSPPNDADSYLMVFFKIKDPSNPIYGAENNKFGCVGWAPVDQYYSSWIDWGLIGGGDVIDYSGNTAVYPTPNGPSNDRNNGTHYYGDNKIRFEIYQQTAKVYVNGIFQYDIPLQAGCVSRRGYIGYGMRGRTNDTSDYMRVKAWRAGPLPVIPVPPTAVPVASFIPTTTTGNTDVPPGLTVNFTDTSTNDPTSWFWDFGDGNTSTEQNPTHVYVTPRLDPYVVSMYCSNVIGTSNTATGQVNAYGGINWDIRPVSSFTMTQLDDSGAVQLTDTSTLNPDTWTWTITNPGGGTYPQQNFTHSFYPNPSQYVVTLAASKAALNAIGVNPTSATAYVNSKTQWQYDFSFAPNDPPYNYYVQSDWLDTAAEAKANLLSKINAHGDLYVRVNNTGWYVESTWYGPFQYNSYNGGLSSTMLIQYNSYFNTTSTFYYGTDGRSTQVSGAYGNYTRVKLDFS